MRITEIYVYPVKALRGIALPAAVVGPQGLRHDRRFMLLTPKPAPDGAVVLDRVQLSRYPQCALFSQALDGDDVVVRFHPPDDDDGGSGAGPAPAPPPPLRFPLAPDLATLAPIAVNLHGSAASRAYDMGAACDAWFSACFGRPIVLAYLGDGRRPVLGTSLRPPREGLGGQGRTVGMAALAVAVVVVAAVAVQAQRGSWTTGTTGMTTAAGLVLAAVAVALAWPGGTAGDPWITFADVAPLLVTSEASRLAVNETMSTATAGGDAGDPVDVPMYKFRPNLVVDGTAAWAEDYWAELVVQPRDGDGTDHGPARRGARLLLTGNCGRCASLNVDYATGRPAAGVLGTVLKRLMADRRVDKGAPYTPVFGRYAFLGGAGEEETTLAVGDAVTVARRNPQRTVWDWPAP